MEHNVIHFDGTAESQYFAVKVLWNVIKTFDIIKIIHFLCKLILLKVPVTLHSLCSLDLDYKKFSLL